MLVNFLFAGDASGVGGFLGNYTSNETLLSIPFSSDQMEQSSTWRELFVLHKFYTSVGAEAFRGKTVLHLCDNVGVSSIIRKGSPKSVLAEMSRDIFLACRKLDIELIVNWESREAELMETTAPTKLSFPCPSLRSPPSHAFYIYRQAEALGGKNILLSCVNIGVTSIFKRDELSGDFSNDSYILSLSALLLHLQAGGGAQGQCWGDIHHLEGFQQGRPGRDVQGYPPSLRESGH